MDPCEGSEMFLVHCGGAGLALSTWVQFLQKLIKHHSCSVIWKGCVYILRYNWQYNDQQKTCIPPTEWLGSWGNQTKKVLLIRYASLYKCCRAGQRVLPETRPWSCGVESDNVQDTHSWAVRMHRAMTLRQESHWTSVILTSMQQGSYALTYQPTAYNQNM